MELRDLSLPEENTEREILNGGEENIPTENAADSTIEAINADEKQSKSQLTKNN